MRPLRLAIEGFTAFRDRQEVDFEPLDLFVITGPTGAGKTSILDAMIFALYGQVPRLGGKSGTADLISLGRVDARVQLDFAVEGQGRSRRAPAVPQGRAVGDLERLEGDDWVPATERGGSGNAIACCASWSASTSTRSARRSCCRRASSIGS